MATSLTYNGYNVTDLDGAYDWSFTGRSYIVSLDFVIYADDNYTTTEAAIVAMLAKMNEPDKDLVVQEGGVTRFSTNQATHVGGFNLEPRCRRLTGESKTIGTVNYFNFTVEVPLGADVRGSTHALFQYGIEDLQVAVKRPFSNIHTLSFSGTWKVVEANANAATVNYLANIQTIINTNYLAVYYAGLTWDIYSDDIQYDRNNKMLSFTIIYRQRAWTYTGDGGTKYILKSLVLTRDIVRQIARIPNYQQKPQGRKIVTVPIGEGKSGYADTYTPPIDYTISGSVEIDITDLTETQAVSKWNSEIRKWVKGELNSAYGSNIYYFENENLSYDEVNSILNFSLKGIEIFQGNLFSLVVKYDEDEQEGEIFESVASGKRYQKIFYADHPDKMQTILISVITINKELENKFFTQFLPPLYDEKKNVGWRITYKKVGTETNRKAFIDKDVTIYVKSVAYNMLYMANSKRIIKSAEIMNSAAKRV